MTMLNRDIPLGQQGDDELTDERYDYGYDDESHANVGSTERTVSAAVGALLAVAGLSRRSVGGLALAALGGGLIYRGVSGHCPVYRAAGIDTSGVSADAASPEDYFEHGIHIEQSFTIAKSPWELY